MREELPVSLWYTSWLPADGTGLRHQNYKFDNPETIEEDLEVILEDVPMFVEVDIS